jgi:hypothetical protein
MVRARWLNWRRLWRKCRPTGARALAWLRAERDACTKLLTHGLPAQRAHARKIFDILLYHRDLASVRGAADLKQLPEDERKAWQTFWADISALLATAADDRL